MGLRVSWIVGCILVLATLAPRVFDLDRFLTADEKRWEANTAGFLRNLSTGDWGHLLQQPHPGITQQWLGAVTVLSDSWTVRKLPLVLSQSVLVLIVAYVFARLWGRWPGLLLGFLLALNPPLVAHTRVYAMDSLLSVFTLLSLGLLLLWRETRLTRYLAASGAAGALAALSKLPGILVTPFALGVLLCRSSSASRPSRWLRDVRSLAVWASACLATLLLVLPSLLTNTVPVLQDLVGFFRSDEYLDAHRGGPTYYLATLAFSSTPLHLLALVTLPILWPFRGRGEGRVRRSHVVTLLLFAFLFVLGMSLGAKKGDRYILPVFLVLDALVVAVAAWSHTAIVSRRVSQGDERSRQAHRLVFVTAVVVILGLLWQSLILWKLHPYALAYVNPLTRPWLGERRMGWGEGLDLAADYLNEKSHAERLKVASWYPVEFGYRFRGIVVPVNHYDDDSVDYVVLYRGMRDRGPDAWETDLLETFRTKKPENVITVNGLDYVWIYPWNSLIQYSRSFPEDCFRTNLGIYPREAIQRSYQSWKTRSVQSFLRWSARPRTCSEKRRETAEG